MRCAFLKCTHLYFSFNYVRLRFIDLLTSGSRGHWCPVELPWAPGACRTRGSCPCICSFSGCGPVLGTASVISSVECKEGVRGRILWQIFSFKCFNLCGGANINYEYEFIITRCRDPFLRHNCADVYCQFPYRISYE
jgi:hypothetical protein